LTIQFSAAAYSAGEGNRQIVTTVTRLGSTAAVASVDYVTSDLAGSNACAILNGNASARCDYIQASGTLSFAAGEASKDIPILIIDDVYAEGDETLSLTLSNPVGGSLGSPASATLTIVENDAVNGTTNPIDQAGFFVREQYLDTLNREPDPDGLAFWTNEITLCGIDPQCIERKRINVSAAFFLSIEFQETGYLVYRLNKAGFGNLPGLPVPVRLNEFLRDTQEISRGIVVGNPGWEPALENSKQAFAMAFVQRPAFIAAFPNSLTAEQFVSQLDANAGGVLSPAETSQLVAQLGATPADVTKRASVLRAVADDADLKNAEFNKAFVLLQYFSYLRRNPDAAPDTNFDGWQFWLNKLTQFNGDFVSAEMVKSFLVSGEYRQRFAPQN
jgi:hypothetical protein